MMREVRRRYHGSGGARLLHVVRIFHIARAREWEAALVHGEYRRSTRDRTLEDEGFIHCGTADQVEAVANAIFRGEPDLVVLVIDCERVLATIRYENLEGGVDQFPHIYGPLNVDAVIEVLAFPPGPDGQFRFPPD